MTSCLLVIIIIIFSLCVVVQGRASLKLQLEETREIILWKHSARNIIARLLSRIKTFKRPNAEKVAMAMTSISDERIATGALYGQHGVTKQIAGSAAVELCRASYQIIWSSSHVFNVSFIYEIIRKLVWMAKSHGLGAALWWYFCYKSNSVLLPPYNSPLR